VAHHLSGLGLRDVIDTHGAALRAQGIACVYSSTTGPCSGIPLLIVWPNRNAGLLRASAGVGSGLGSAIVLESRRRFTVPQPYFSSLGVAVLSLPRWSAPGPG